MKTEYVIIQRRTPEELEIKVNQMIDNGWIVQGGVSVVRYEQNNNNTFNGYAYEEIKAVFLYFQAMLFLAKEDKSENEEHNEE
jgi:hypothetical protein